MNKRIRKKKSTVIIVSYKNYDIYQLLYNKKLALLDTNTFHIIGVEKLKKRISKNKMVTYAKEHEEFIDDILKLAKAGKIDFNLEVPTCSE